MDTADHLQVAWRAWAETGSRLTADQWATPTRLPGWTVTDVYAHHSIFPTAILNAITSGTTDSPVTHDSAAELLAMFNAPGGPAHTMSDRVRDHARSRANGHSRSELLDQFQTTAPQALDLARSVDPDRRVHYAGLAVLTVREALRIALLEAVVHYLDVARAVELSVPGPMTGTLLRATAALLTEVADPLDFVEQATGRSDVEVLPVIR